MIAITAFLAAAAYFTSPVAAHAASQLSVEVIQAQFVASGIVPDVIPEFDPVGVFIANYTGVGRVQGGQVLTIEQAATFPEISLRGTDAQEADESTVFHPANNETDRFTIILFDANYPGSENPNGYNVHYLANHLNISAPGHNSIYIGETEGSSVVVEYAGPNPPEGTGPHRYVWLAFEEPEGFTPPSSPAVGSGVQLLDVAGYLEEAGLTPLVGVYFTVESGTATVSVEATSSIDNSTLPAFTSTEEHGSSHSAEQTTSVTPSAAGRNAISAIAVFFAAVVGIASL